MIKYNTIDMVFHIPSNHNLLPNGTGSLSSTQQPNTTYYQFPTLLNTVASGHSIHVNNDKRYFALDGTRQAIRSTSTVYYKNGNNIQFECDFILRSIGRNVLYCVGSSSGTNESTSVFEVCVYQNSIVVELGSKMFESNYTFEANIEYHILVTATKDGLLININGEKVSNFDKNISSTAFLSIPTGNYYHFIGNNTGTGSASNPPIGLDGYITNIFTSFNGMMIQREHKDYTNNDYNKILNFKLELDGSDSESKHVSKFDIVNVYDRPFSYVYDGVTFAVGQALSVNVLGADYYVKFGVDVKKSHVDALIFNNGEYEIRLSGGFVDPNPEPKVMVNENTTSALDFEDGLVDKVGTTIWNKEGTADVTSDNKLFGNSSFETKALGDSLYTNSNVITGGSTPFTIEFYALIKGGSKGVSSPYQIYPLFSKAKNVGAGEQFFYIDGSLGNKLAFQRQSNAGTIVTILGGQKNIRLNEINKFTFTYDSSALRLFINDKIDSIAGTLNGFVPTTSEPYRFLRNYVSSYSGYESNTLGLIDNINIHDGIATKVRDPDPYEEFLVVDLAFDGENNSTKIVDNARLNERNEIKYNDNIISLVNFNDDNINDEVGNRTWSITGSSYTFIDGKFSKALDITGENNIIQSDNITEAEKLSNSQNFTVEYWVKLNSDTNGTIFSRGKNGYTLSYSCSISLTGVRWIQYRNGSGSSGESVSAPYNFSIDEWYHIAIVGYTDYNREIFINGESIVKQQISSSWYTSSNDPLRIGSLDYLPSYAYWFKGAIEGLRITNGVARYTENFTPPTEPYKYIPKNNWTVSGNAKLSTDQKFDGFSSLKNDRSGYLLCNTQPITSSDISTISFEFYIESINNNNVYYDTYDGSYNNTFQLMNYRGKFVLWYSNITVEITTLENRSKNKITFIYNNRNVKVYVNGYLKLDTTLDIDLNFGNKFALFGQGVYPNPSYYSDGYFKNFKIYKGVAVIPESPVGKIQLDFDNILVDKYGNSTWTNNGVTFDQVNSVKGYAAYFYSNHYIQTTSNDFKYGTSNFDLSFDMKPIGNRGTYAELFSSNSSSWVNGNSALSCFSNGAVRIASFYNNKDTNLGETKVLDNTYYKINFVRKNDVITTIHNDVVVDSKIASTVQIGYNPSFDFDKIGRALWSGTNIGYNGYLDNVKSYKEDLLNINSSLYKTNSNVNVIIDNDSLYVSYNGTPPSSPDLYATLVLNDSPILKNFKAVMGVYLKSEGKNYGILNFRTADYSLNNMDKFGYSCYITTLADNTCHVRFGAGGNGSSSWAELGSWMIPTSYLDNTYHSISVTAIDNEFVVYFDGDEVLNITNNSYSASSNFALCTYLIPNMSGISSRTKSLDIYDIENNLLYHKDFKSKIENIIDRPAVHLPLETNAINTGFSALTINSVGNPTYTTIDGKKCIKFESGKYLTINSNNIFNLGTNSDFYIEFDFYPLVDKYHHLISAGSSVADLTTIAMSRGDSPDGNNVYVYAGGVYILTTEGIRWELNKFNNIKLYRKGTLVTLSVNGHTFTTTTSSNFDFSKSYTTIGQPQFNTGSYCDGYMSNFKMFVGTSEIPETYNDKKVLDLDFKPTGKSYLFKDNNNKCVIHPFNITQRDYQDSQYCCTFNGTNQYLQLGKNDLLNFGLDDFIIELDFKLIGDYTYNAILYAGGDTISRSYISIFGSTHPNFPNKIGLTNSGGGSVISSVGITNIIIGNRYNVKFVRRGSYMDIYINDVLDITVEINNQTYNFNLNGNTAIGRVMSNENEYFKGTIYSIKILRNTTDLTLLEDELSLVQTDLTYKLINTTDQTEQQITIDSSTSNIQIERDSSNVTLSVDDQTISLPTTTQPESNEIVLFGEYTDGIQNEITIYDKKPLTESTYIIPELDYTPLPYEVVDGEETITKFQVVDAGEHTIDGFTEGHPNAEYRIINKYSGMTLLHGRDSYYNYGINPLYIQNYVVELPELGITYPLEDHAMKRGYITYNMSPNDLCVGSDYVLRLIRRHDGRIVGEYEFVDYVCVVENLDCDVKYDAILFDRNDMFESITMSNRTPRPSE